MNSEHSGGNVFQQTEYIFGHIQNIIKTNILTKFHKDWTKNEKCPAPGRHIFQPTGRIVQHVKDIIRTNFGSKFHEYQTINVAFRVLTRKNATPTCANVFQSTEKCPAPWCTCFQPTQTIFKLVQDIIRMALLTKFHEDRTIHVASREKCPTPGDHKNLLTKFHDDRIINVAYRVLTSKNAPPLGGHFHEDRTINVTSRMLTSHIWKNAPPPGGHVFKATGTLFELFQDIIVKNLLTKFHDDRNINGFYCSHIMKNAPLPCGHVFQPTVIIFELVQDIIEII
ncbi:hypothetical protein DPMN_092522 [Dreissena polymorpha]|uniref:Uncharacterized protein n=1 Tax=Dreissena polymorpha TaxID=45954 RepID=A0A9D4L1X0_DREPO|nr:hypothetical protein DPMN_092522 [Dreissena polymorpha]